METHYPPEFFAAPPPAEAALVELSRAVDHVIDLAHTFNAADLAMLKREYGRLVDILLDAAQAGKAA